jgi:Leucine-rich repeat (LRR) protein
LKIEGSTKEDKLARSVQIFHECQIDPSSFYINASIYNPANVFTKESYKIEEILETLKSFRIRKLMMRSSDQVRLESLSADTFNHFLLWNQSLEEFHIYDSFLLDSIGAETFCNFTSLKKLNLIRLEIKEVSVEAFKGLSRLEELYLKFNEIRNLELGMFDDLVNLRYLSLEENKLQTLEPGLFRSLNKLDVLKLSHNPLRTDQHEDAFLGLENLSCLYLKNTPFSGAVKQDLHIAKKHVKNQSCRIFLGI